VVRTLVQLKDTLGDRRMVLARELTKKFEEVMRGRISEVIARLEETTIRGEIVLVVAGREEPAEDEEPETMNDERAY
jgi:16S rRNA (cytidine1402-2'-O)-methyltransferase